MKRARRGARGREFQVDIDTGGLLDKRMRVEFRPVTDSLRVKAVFVDVDAYDVEEAVRKARECIRLDNKWLTWSVRCKSEWPGSA